jgi:uncharacterized damage-inducible protein DinB
MKELLMLLAEYNQTANTQLYDLLENGNPDLISKKTGSYFDTILGLLNHVLTSDLRWLAGFRDSNLELPVLGNPILDYDDPGWGNNLYDEFADLEECRSKTDALFIDFVAATPEQLFAGPIEITRPDRSRTVTFPFGKIMLHVFNHQTHHRGAISHILDQSGVDNDYSNVMQLLM